MKLPGYDFNPDSLSGLPGHSCELHLVESGVQALARPGLEGGPLVIRNRLQ